MDFYVNNEKIDIVLENENARIVFDGGNQFRIKSFEMEGVDIAASYTTPPWEVELLGPRGENPLLKPGMAFYDGGVLKDCKAQFTWRLLLEGSTENYAIMTVSLVPGMQMPEFNFELLLPEHGAIFAYTRTGGGERVLVVCNFYGDTIPDPLADSEAGELLIGSYEDPGLPGTLRPYEARMYRMKEG